MRIPLDYYRILGIPSQSTDEQLTQAHDDRILQLPRREYSDLAIIARKQLLDRAYQVLSDSKERYEYDARFRAQTYGLESLEDESRVRDDSGDTLWIEIPEEQFVGALLILQELGEYELVLKLGNSYLNQDNIGLAQESSANLKTLQKDIVLTIALACAELSRENWQQRKYENAANFGETGQKLLLKQGLFVNVRREIETDLYKLRPYRILELLALPEDSSAERSKGLQLLKEMLEVRGGIDGSGKDPSGLNIDEFLRFIQQLRSYLTTAEQQELFEAEAERPSAVGTYLAVYALLARGFAEKTPTLILRAKQMLRKLGKHQDVYLERAVCSLLLGQTDEATRALELSQEDEALAFIRENSQGSPDLLPGLCLYAERWLQTEVFANFRDLVNTTPLLKEYFADDRVQTYLEELPAETEPQHRGSVMGSSPNPTIKNPLESLPMEQPKHLVVAEDESSPEPKFLGTNGGGTATVTKTKPAPTSPDPIPQRPQKKSWRSTLSRILKKDLFHGQTRGVRGRKKPMLPKQSSSNARPQRIRSRSGTRQPLRKKTRPSRKVRRLVFLVILALLGLGLFGLLYKWLEKITTPPPMPILLEGEQLYIDLNESTVTIPSLDAILTTSGPLTKETGELVIKNWLESKSQAFGKSYKIDAFKTILAEPLLSQKSKRAEVLKSSNSYLEYQHKVKVLSVQTNKQNPNQATVEAAVRENASYYVNEQLNKNSSYDDNLIVRYNLQRQNENEEWLIKEIKVVK